jgi:hypothetical protein
MLIPHVVQTEADKVFVNVLNNQGSSVTDGEVIAWNTSTPDGVRTTQPAANTLTLVVGLADGTIAASAYGLAQAYGYKASGSVVQDTSVTIAAGDALKAAVQDYLVFAGTGGAGSALGFVYYADASWATDSTSTATAKKVFIRAL